MSIELVAPVSYTVEVTLPVQVLEVPVAAAPVVIERVYAGPLAVTKQVFVQSDLPAFTEASMWWETDPDTGDLVTLWVEDGL